MRIFTVAAAAVMVGAISWVLLPQTSPSVDPIVSGSIQRDAPQRFAVTNNAGQSACTAERGAPVSRRSREFSAPADCNAVWPGLASAKTWTENEDGTVILADASGEAVLMIVAGDGPGYEAIEPAEADIALRTAD